MSKKDSAKNRLQYIKPDEYKKFNRGNNLLYRSAECILPRALNVRCPNGHTGVLYYLTFWWRYEKHAHSTNTFLDWVCLECGKQVNYAPSVDRDYHVIPQNN